MVIKILKDNLYIHFHGERNNKDEIVFSPYPRKSFPHGKVTLSIKVSKRKRVLVNGFVSSDSYSCKESGLYYTYYFKPNNMEKLRNAVLSGFSFPEAT